ncbi:hypothetical protein M378DRAFT_159745 [Amanita muscaria Koide BX008]|uniref:Uncharacterized protein n=1 Tax=Amanita muscaria (strain Koide BX008) TaxID=946122 RepID=A0A0C2TJZ1_AMAMK|nr:hypothetical protein M378DRAFT_159745 [Amanita muscaria Koide BX008]
MVESAIHINNGNSTVPDEHAYIYPLSHNIRRYAELLSIAVPSAVQQVKWTASRNSSLLPTSNYCKISTITGEDMVLLLWICIPVG